jgi:hypothetical protein
MLDYFGDYTAEDPLSHARFTRTSRQFLGDEAFAVLGRAFLELHEQAARKAGKARWADKNPENAIHLEHWERLLGDSWLFVHVVRDPLDVIASMEEAGFPYSDEDRVRKRSEHVERYARAASRYAAGCPDRCLTVRYEDLVTRPEPEINRLMAFLGESLEEAQLAASAPREPGLGDPKAGEKVGFDPRGIGRWRRDLGRRELDLIRDALTSLPGTARRGR